MPQVSMSQGTFENLEEQINEHKDKFVSFTKTGMNTGIIVTKDVTIDFMYNPMTQFLQFNIGAKHSLAAKIAGDNVIAQHVIAVLHDLPQVAAKPLVKEPFILKTSGIDGDAGDWTEAGDGTTYPEVGEVAPNPVAEVTDGIVVKTPKPATEVTNGGTSSEQVS